MERVRLVATVLFVAILTSCSPGNGAAPLMSDAKAPERVVARTGAADHLYVGVCGSCDRGKIDEINVYPAGSVTAAHTIRTGIYNPSSMTMDRTGDLYVVNEALVNSSIAVYPPGATTPSLTIAITIPQPTGLTVDNEERLHRQYTSKRGPRIRRRHGDYSADYPGSFSKYSCIGCGGQSLRCREPI